MVVQTRGQGGGRTVHFSPGEQLVVREEILLCVCVVCVWCVMCVEWVCVWSGWCVMCDVWSVHIIYTV